MLPNTGRYACQSTSGVNAMKLRSRHIFNLKVHDTFKVSFETPLNVHDIFKDLFETPFIVQDTLESFVGGTFKVQDTF